MCHRLLDCQPVPEEGTIEGLRERKRAATRATTVDVALALFAEHGYDQVTVADICEAAEIAPRTFFRYFPAKEDVLAEPAREMAAEMEASIASAPAGLSHQAVLHRALLELGRHVVANEERLAVFFRVAAQAPAVRLNPFGRLADRERQITELLAARGGAPTDWVTRVLVARSVAVFRVWLDEQTTGETPDPLAHLAEMLVP